MAGAVFEWGPWRFEPSECRLLRDETIVPLPAKTLDLLLTLLSRAPRLVTKDEILTAVWRDAAVEEGNIAFHIAALRKVLDEDGSESSIETVRGKGYRFVHQVAVRQMPPTESLRISAPDSAAAPSPPRRSRWLIPVAAAIAVAAVAVFAWLTSRSETPTVAIAQFDIVSPGPGQESFPDGLAVYTSTALQLVGIATSAGADQKLSAQLQPIDNGFRVFVQLTRATDGARLWNWTFDVSADVNRPAAAAGPDDARSRIQAEIATRIADGLRGYFNLSGAGPVTR